MSLKLLVMALLITSCLGCQHKPIPVTITVQETINLDRAHQPAPLYIKFYQLSDPARLQAVGIRELWQDEQAVLGNSLLAVNPYTVFPGEAQRQTLRLDRAMTAICVVGFYRQPWDKHWVDCLERHTLSRYWGMQISVDIQSQGIYLHDL